MPPPPCSVFSAKNIIAAHLRPEGPFRVDLKKNLSSSTTAGTKVDVNLVCYAFHPPTVSLDITVSCPLLPSYLPEAVHDAAAVFAARDREKRSKHLAGSAAQNRTYRTLCLISNHQCPPLEASAVAN